ncbi:TetR/AcrR family transcriptional regulator [Pseudonocardia sp. KRD291]|uniref:TetR/AcrR family transcriptional regulator n=1 Tax=Pseudonocardia sp. KRD291 TaxID=2792007 RepID=UPI001C4A07DF|nr:TetR/AcrR family transcriptional regulator [Pseudonocardia sp. KRD291]MBW0105416.1 TetR/AcrR family transcriptional regulator [Pseudonocardia sp. KRD291]
MTPDPDGHGSTPRLTPGARRILDVASELFYRRGIHAVGVDTIAAESGVTKRTLYDRFGSKDELVTAYLRARDLRWRALVVAAADAAPDPVRRALAPFDVLGGWLDTSDRGCSLVNAYAELPDPAHPARALITEEKRWLRELFRAALAEAGVPDPDTLAGQLLLLHEGAMVTFSVAEDPGAAAAARSAAAALLGHASA